MASAFRSRLIFMIDSAELSSLSQNHKKHETKKTFRVFRAIRGFLQRRRRVGPCLDAGRLQQLIYLSYTCFDALFAGDAGL